MKHCPYCGEKIAIDATECKHCGKALVASKESKDSSINLQSWEKKAVPGWVMWLSLALLALVLVFMVQKGCENANRKSKKSESKSEARLIMPDRQSEVSDA